MKLVVGPGRHLAAALDLSGPADLMVLQSPDAAAHASEDPRIGRRVTFRFNDIAAARPGLIAPTAGDVADLLAFGGAASTLVIHCFAGVSRSTAAAYALACQATAPGREAELAETLRALSPAATPNPLIVALADTALGREGRMVDAIAAIGRGAEAFEGPVFVWSLGAD